MKLGVANKLLNIQYEWRKKSINGPDLTMSNSEYLRLNSFTKTNQGIYYCTAINELSRMPEKSTSFTEVNFDR